MTDAQLEAWSKLPDYKMDLKTLQTDLGLSLQDIATAAVDGVAPAQAWPVLGAPIVQAEIDRISRARLTAVLARVSDTLAEVAKALQGNSDVAYSTVHRPADHPAVPARG